MSEKGREQREPLSEDYLRAHTIGELIPLSGPVRVVDWKHTQNYADAKTSVIDEIMSRAGHP